MGKTETDMVAVPGNKFAVYEDVITDSENAGSNTANQAEDARGTDRKTKNSPGHRERDSKTESVPVLFL